MSTHSIVPILLTHDDCAQHCNQECWHSRLPPPVSHQSMAMKITQFFCSGMPYMNHLVSHTALPEAGASKNLPLEAEELGYYSLAGHTAIRGSVAPDGITRGRAVAPRSIQGPAQAVPSISSPSPQSGSSKGGWLKRKLALVAPHPRAG